MRDMDELLRNWELKLKDQASHVAESAEAEGRTLFTAEEERKLESIMVDFQTVLMLKKASQ